MKLKNSFLIGAGVFFFAVAFLNYAKAGDDGGKNPDAPVMSQSNMKTVVDQDCTAYFWIRVNPYTLMHDTAVTELDISPGEGFIKVDSEVGKKDACEW